MARTKARHARANNLFQIDKDPWDIEHEAALAKFGPVATTEQLYPLAVHRGFEVNAYGKELIRRYPAFRENELHHQSLTKHLKERLGLPKDSDVTFTSEQLWKEHDRLKQEEADEEYEDESADDAAHSTSGVGPSSDTVPTAFLGKYDDDGVSKTTEGPLPLPPGVEEEDLATAVISKEAISAFALAFGPPGYKLPSPFAPTEERSSDSGDDGSTPPASPRPQGRNGRISLRAGSKRSTQVVDYRELDPSSSDDDDESSDEDDLGQVVEPPKKKRKVQARKGKGRSQARRG